MPKFPHSKIYEWALSPNDWLVAMPANNKMENAVASTSPFNNNESKK